MAEYVTLLSIPGLRASDLERMPNLSHLVEGGDHTSLAASFPAVTCPVQSNMTTGTPPCEHGVVANGFYWRDKDKVEMWTAWNEVVQQPQLWDRLKEHNPAITSAVWFPMLVKGCGADYVCTPAPIHNPDGSESLWCYTKPEMLYGELRDEFGHFPLQHFWGPIAKIDSSAWIIDSAIHAAHKYRPNLFYIYLPHLDYAAQKHGPDSPEAHQATVDLDREIGRLIEGFQQAYKTADPLWLVASEYVITPVDHVTYPNRILREAGLLEVSRDADGRELIDRQTSKAWALVDHQLSHVFVNDSAPEVVEQVTQLFVAAPGVAEVLSGDGLARYDLQHPRAGDLVLVSESNSWQSYYYWRDDELAPKFTRTVDIHRKPGYDPVELFFDPANKGIPLDASLVKGSHGAPPTTDAQRGVMLSSKRGVFVERTLCDTDVADLVLRQFGV